MTLDNVKSNKSVQRMSAESVSGDWMLGMALITDLCRSAETGRSKRVVHL